MANELSHLEALARETHKSEAEIITWVFQKGLAQLWREHVLGQFLRGEITRAEAIDNVGIDWVELAEREQKAVLEDLQWAMR